MKYLLKNLKNINKITVLICEMSKCWNLYSINRTTASIETSRADGCMSFIQTIFDSSATLLTESSELTG